MDDHESICEKVEAVHEELHEYRDHPPVMETHHMSDTAAILAAMSGRNDNDGLGGGLIGGVVLGALLGRNGGGLFGGNDGNCGRVGGDISGLNNTQGAIATSAILSNLADIKAAVPLSEAQVQLALAGSTNALSNQISNSAQFLSMGQNQIQLAILAGQAALSKEICDVDTNVDRQSTAIQMAICADGEKTRALITQNQIVDLQRQLGVAQLEGLEQRSVNRENVNSHNTTVTVNQMQAQQQLQAQRNEFLLSQLVGGFGQLAKATNSSVVVGSTGVGTSQTANPTNVVA